MKVDQNPIRQRLKVFALRVIKVCESLPQNTQGWVLGKQLLKAGTSIGANYCEALRASSRPHFIAILEISLREAAETQYWLELLVESDIMKASLINELYQECEAIIRILAATIKTSKQTKDTSP